MSNHTPTESGPRLSAAPTSTLSYDDRFHSVLVQENELSTIRAKAVNWGKGLAGLLTIIAGFSLIKGPSEIMRLADAYAWAVGIVLALSVMLGVVATFRILRAAYGSTMPVAQTPDGSAWVKTADVVPSGKALRQSIVLSCITLALLMFAIGITWYGPSDEGPRISVQLATGVMLCGYPEQSVDGVMLLRTDRGTVSVKLVEAITIQPVTTCPMS